MPKKAPKKIKSASRILWPQKLLLPLLAGVILTVGLVVSMILSTINQDNRPDAAVAVPELEKFCRPISGTCYVIKVAKSVNCPNGMMPGTCPSSPTPSCGAWSDCVARSGAACVGGTALGTRTRNCEGKTESQDCSVSCKAATTPVQPTQVQCCVNGGNRTCPNSCSVGSCGGGVVTTGACANPTKCYVPGSTTLTFNNGETYCVQGTVYSCLSGRATVSSPNKYCGFKCSDVKTLEQDGHTSEGSVTCKLKDSIPCDGNSIDGCAGKALGTSCGALSWGVMATKSCKRTSPYVASCFCR